MRSSYRRAGTAAVSAAMVAAFTVIPFGHAAQAASPAASAFGARVQVSGTDVIPPTPEAVVATRPGDATKTAIDVPAQPVIVNGTLTATANSHGPANIPTGLTVVQQATPGPYNGRALAQIEGASVLYEVAGAGVPLLSADAIRSEAAVVCGTTPTYTANSEVVDLNIGGTDIPLNAPVSDLIDAISGVLTDSGLNAVADVQRNVVTQLPGGGVGVDALVVTVLAAVGDTPLAQVRLAHSEVSAAACTPLPQCSDGVDNDADVKVDSADPGCHSDGNAGNPASYVPSDNDEHDAAAAVAPADASRAATLPRTGGEETLALTVAAFATVAAALRRWRGRIAAA